MRTLSQVFKTESSGDQIAPIEIYDVFLDTQTLHYAQYPEDVAFFDLDGSATTYTALPIERDPAKATSDLSINHIMVRVANVDKAMSVYLANNEFRGRRLVVRKIFKTVSVASGDAARIFDGIMDSPAADEKWLTVVAVDRIGSLMNFCPKRHYQLLCNWKFGSTECAINLSDAINSGDSSVDSATATVITDNSLPNGASGDDWYVNGYVQFTSGNLNNARRRIKDSDATTFTVDVDLSEAPANGDTYTIWRGCDQTWLICSGDFVNGVNFGSFPTIPEQMVLR